MSNAPDDFPRVMRADQSGKGPAIVAAEVELPLEPTPPQRSVETEKASERARWAQTQRAARLADEEE